jgi:AmmeMemoRadiSam system protein A
VTGPDSETPLSPGARQRLFDLAHRAIEAGLQHRTPEVAEAEGELAESRGVFVTIRRRPDHELRGCIGFVQPREPLALAVSRAAMAALEDLRFDPVTPDELPLLEVEISVLGRPVRVRPEDVRVGTHGLIVKLGGQGGVLLPQVAAERGWDRETFLDQTCRKAGLPPGTWRDPGCQLLAFTAAVLHEAPVPEPSPAAADGAQQAGARGGEGRRD